MSNGALIEALRVARDVGYQADLEDRRLRHARRDFILLSLLVAMLLGLDYTTAHIMFTYLDPTLGGVSLGPEFLALTVPTAVVAVHLLIAEEGGKAIEYRLKRLAGVGVFVFLLGMATMVSLVYFDASGGVGWQSQGSGIEGTLGSADIGASTEGHTSWLLVIFGALFASVAPVLFFAGMTLILFVTVYASHRLMVKLEEHYEFFANASRRSRELIDGIAELEELGTEIRKIEARIATARKKLPSDPEHRFAHIASAAIRDALHRMKLALRNLRAPNPLLEGVVTRKSAFPPETLERDQAARLIADIRQATTPYAILRDLDAYPPREEE